ncbi:uncharacterized protein LOC144580101 isoform X2 [Callithrix jacchus]
MVGSLYREIRGLRQFMEAAGVLLFQGFEKNRRTSADTFGKTKLDSTSSGMEQVRRGIKRIPTSLPVTGRLPVTLHLLRKEIMHHYSQVRVEVEVPHLTCLTLQKGKLPPYF